MIEVLAFLKRLRADRNARLLFVRYVSIGGLSQVADIGLFLALVRVGVINELAGAISIIIATSFHFLMNKYKNFRNHDRTMRQQLGTYCLVGLGGILISVIVISFSTHVLHAPPLVCKVLATIVNFPYGYFGHRYLTFGLGIVGSYRHWLSKQGTQASNVPQISVDEIRTATTFGDSV